MKIGLSLFILASALVSGCSVNNYSEEKSGLASAAKSVNQKEYFHDRPYIHCTYYGCGIKSTSGEQIVPDEYVDLRPSLNNTTIRNKFGFVYSIDGNNSGFMNYDYQIITPPIFSSRYVQPIIQENGYYSFRENVDGNVLQGVGGLDGVVFSPIYHSIFAISESYFTYQKTPGSKWGMLDKNGRNVVDEDLDEPVRSYVYPDVEERIYVFQKDGEVVISNDTDEVLFRGDDLVLGSFSNGYFSFERDGGAGIMKATGEVVLEPIYHYIGVYSSTAGSYVVHGENGKGCYSVGREAFDFFGNYQHVSCSGGRNKGYVELDGYWRLVMSDESLGANHYDSIGPISNIKEDADRYLEVMVEDEWGVVDSITGEEVVQVAYKRIAGFDPAEQVALVETVFGGNKVFKVVDREGESTRLILGRPESNVMEVGEEIYAIYEGFFRPGHLKNVVYFDLKNRTIL